MKTKILLWHWGRRGGGPRYTLELARALSTNSEIEIALSLSLQCEIYNEFSGVGVSRFDVNTYDSFSSVMVQTAKLPFLRKDFWHFVEREKIDLIVCTMSHLWDVPILIGKKIHPPFLLVLHDAVPHPGDDILFRSLLLKNEVNKADAVVTLSTHVQQQLCQEYSFPKELTWVIPHGIFPYIKLASQRNDQIIKILFFGRILPYKGLDLLLDALFLLKDKELNLHVNIVGPGDIKKYTTQIEQLDFVSVDNRWIPEEEIAGIFSSVDVTILPYREASQSGVIATSFAVGVPVIVTPSGGLIEQVDNRVNGLIAKSITSEAIADSITEIVQNDILRNKCSRGAKYTAENDLSWTKIAQSFGEVFISILGK
jgi:glycosyltransferase involved in cell wall biosynthesis